MISKQISYVVLFWYILIIACSAQEQALKQEQLIAQHDQTRHSDKSANNKGINLAIYFTGIERGNNCKKFSKEEKEIYENVYGLLKHGENKASFFFNKLHNAKGGENFAKKGVHFFAGDVSAKNSGEKIIVLNEQIERIKSNSSLLDDKIEASRLGISFFTLDDTIVLTETTSMGMKKVALYILISFFLFNFDEQLVIYSSQFVVPLESNTEKDTNTYTFIKEALRDEKGKRFKKLLKELSISILRDKMFKQIVTNFTRFNTLRANKNYGQVSIGKITQAHLQDISERYQMKLKNENKFRQLAAYMATIRFCNEIPMIPPFAGEINYMDNQKQALTNVIKNKFQAVGEEVTHLKYIDLNAKSNHGIDRFEDSFELKDLFQQSKYQFNFDIELVQRRLSKNSFRIQDRVQASMELKIFEEVTDPRTEKIKRKELQPKSGRNRLKIISDPIEHSFVFGENVRMSDAYFYNAMLKGLLKKRNEVIFDDNVGANNGIYESVQ
jgi:hypothetical protein